MSTTAREHILESVKKALSDNPASKDPALLPERIFPELKPDIVEAFGIEFEAQGGKLFKTRGKKGVTGRLDKLLMEHQIKKVAVWNDPLLDEINLIEHLTESGIEVITVSAGQNSSLISADCELGITSADMFLAETGTIIVSASYNMPRSFSLVPPIHLAIIRKDKIMPGLEALYSSLKAQSADKSNLPSAIHLITGPSRTADIELVLTKGVHGPKIVYAIVF